MSRSASWVAPFAVTMVAILCVSGAAFARPEIGQPAPLLVVEQLDGQTFNLAQAHGTVVVVNFWATWCPPCRKEMPALDAVYQRYHDHGLDMIGLSADRPRDRSDATKVMQSFSYPAAMLDDAKDNGFGDPTALPVTYVVDAQGIVRAKLTPDSDPVTEKGLTDLLLPLLAQTHHSSVEAR